MQYLQAVHHLGPTLPLVGYTGYTRTSQ